jgi:hypothetical protein
MQELRDLKQLWTPRARWPSKTWTEVAHEFGYHDRMDLVHDFAEFCSEGPGSVLTELEMTYQTFCGCSWLGHQTEEPSLRAASFYKVLVLKVAHRAGIAFRQLGRNLVTGNGLSFTAAIDAVFTFSSATSATIIYK